METREVSNYSHLKDTLTAENSGVSSCTPKVRPRSVMYTPKLDDEHLRPFHIVVPQPHLHFIRETKNTSKSSDVTPLDKKSGGNLIVT